jgi:hypothetical protein
MGVWILRFFLLLLVRDVGGGAEHCAHVRGATDG